MKGQHKLEIDLGFIFMNSPTLIVQALWRAVKHVERAVPHGINGGEVLVLGLRRVEHCCTYSFTLETVHLILHQCYKRRDNQGDTTLSRSLSVAGLPVHVFERKRWHLIAEGFAAAWD